MLSVLRATWGGVIAAVVVGIAAQAWGAQPSADEVLEVPEVVVGATRLRDVGIDIRRVPANVTVITAEEIQAKGARTVQEALRDVPGLAFYDNSGNNFQQTVDLRGFNGNPVGTTVLLDGARINEPGLNQVNWEMVPLEHVERIEVLPGPGGSVYGRNALGGVINIVTKRGGRRIEAFGEVAGGSFGRFRSTATLGGQVPYGFDLSGGYTRDQEDGWRGDSEARINRAFGKLGWRYKDATDVALSYTYTQSRIHQAGSLTTFELNTNRRLDPTCCDINPSALHHWVLNVRQRLPWGFSLALNGFERILDSSSFVVFRSGPGAFGDARNRSEQTGGTAQISHESSPFGWRNVLSAGADFERAEMDSLTFSFFPPATRGVDDQGLQENSVGFFAQDVLDITKYVTLTAGVRYDRDLIHLTDRGQAFAGTFFGFPFAIFTPSRSGFARNERVSPRAGLTVRPTEWGTLYFNFADGFRGPRANEILAAGGGTFLGGGLRLRPVLSRNLEAGARVKGGEWGEASLALYTSEVRNEIFPVVTGLMFGFPLTQNQNVPRTRRQGLEFSAKAWWKPWVDGFLTYSWTEARFATEFPLASPDFSTVIRVHPGHRVPLVPEHRLNVGINVHPFSWLTLSISEHWVSDAVPLGDDFNMFGRQAGYWVTNAAIRATYKGLTAFVHLNNVFDQKYETFSIVAAPTPFPTQTFRVPALPFNVFAGVSYRFELPFATRGSGVGGQGSGK